MGWLFYTFVQVLITIGFLVLAIEAAPSAFSLVFLLGAVLFFFRSINHPDFWLRRGFLVCLALGSSHLALGNIMNLDPNSFHPIWQALIGILKVLLSPGPWVGFGLLIVAAIFAILELIRMYILGSETFGDRAFVQIMSISEQFLDDEMAQRIQIEASISNHSSRKVTLTHGKLTRFGLFPITLAARVDVLRGSVELPGNHAIEIDPKESISVLASADFRMWPYTLRKLRLRIQKTKLYQWLFAFRSLSFRTRSTSGSNVLAKDSVRRYL